jgi:inorganic pyrophosphatase
MLDRNDPDDKILAVPDKDPLYRDYKDLKDIPKHFLDEVAHFFSVYKDLEGARVEVIGWEPAAAAKEQIQHATQLYQSTFQPPKL